MKGFIDLIFRWKGKYYILDYKSNHLGNSESSYLMDELSREMNHSNYILQYHIYLIAFLRFIRTKNPLFDYENEFGGIIYLFLRGIHPIKPTSGVYFDKPKVALLNYLDELMRGFK
jgi:exodeoxyribonuclease V beta subunit